ncbi:hypothetical protein N7456_003606 [Penicillium angulare]|uniref:Uncharacterized protein n=1 Tax=Penicillium angulare TaxID=116970 RepID=A0A9W9FUY9_9EURO|nr:hypothetical protein N7456_003606 [Penicillium angulare]
MTYYASFNGFQIFATYFYEEYQGLSTIETTKRFLPSGVLGCESEYHNNIFQPVTKTNNSEC